METTPAIQNQNLQGPLDDLQLTATVPQEMIECQSELILWAEKKIAELKKDADELAQATAYAKKNKWRWQVHDRHHKLTLKRISFYEKLLAASKAGYYVVPNFPVQLFAVRTDRDKPLKMITTSTSVWNDRFTQNTHDQPLGEGEYKNPRPVVYQKKIDEKNFNFWAERWQEEIDFPVNMAKPIIMEATERAMALKIFDRFGILPGTSKKQDPMIIGQIVRKHGWQEHIVSFIVAWHLDTRIL